MLLVLGKTAEAQINYQDIMGNWVSEELDFIYIIDSSGYRNYMSNTRHRLKPFQLDISHDTLTANIDLTYRDSAWEHMLVFQFKIEELSDSFLTLIPINQSSKSFFSHFSLQGKIQFIRQEYDVDYTIEFSKLSYSNNECQSGCEYVQCRIDSSRNITLYLDCMDKFGKLDTIRSGKYAGVLDTALYNDLIFHLQSSQLKKTSVSKVWMSHRKEIYLDIRFSEITKEFESRPHPLNLHRLDDFLCDLYLIKESLNREDN